MQKSPKEIGNFIYAAIGVSAAESGGCPQGVQVTLFVTQQQQYSMFNAKIN